MQAYNSICSFSKMIEFTHYSTLFDTKALQSVSGGLDFKTWDDVVARAMCDLTCTMRFTGAINSDLRTHQMNLVPFRTSHFLTCSTAPNYPNVANGTAPAWGTLWAYLKNP